MMLSIVAGLFFLYFCHIRGLKLNFYLFCKLCRVVLEEDLALGVELEDLVVHHLAQAFLECSKF